ncbi:MAG: signal peptidase II [Eubacteriales bacterium]|nr:signal peptidase II [Eubacteriales bacterium]
MWLLYAVVVGVIILDRISKLVVIMNMPLSHSIPVIKYILNFTYVRNTGAAFSMFSNSNIILGIVATAVVIAAIIYFHIKKPSSKYLIIYSGMIMGGAIGNVIDRFIYSYVIDFIDIQFMEFAVFNIADCFIVVGCIFLAAWIMIADGNNKEVTSIDK